MSKVVEALSNLIAYRLNVKARGGMVVPSPFMGVDAVFIRGKRLTMDDLARAWDSRTSLVILALTSESSAYDVQPKTASGRYTKGYDLMRRPLPNPDLADGPVEYNELLASRSWSEVHVTTMMIRAFSNSQGTETPPSNIKVFQVPLQGQQDISGWDAVPVGELMQASRVL